jgi:hypothetical protein
MVPHIKKWHDYYLFHENETAYSNQILYLIILSHTIGHTMPMKKITIAIPGDLLDNVDSVAAKEGSDRSHIIVDAIGLYLNGDRPA